MAFYLVQRDYLYTTIKKDINTTYTQDATLTVNNDDVIYKAITFSKPAYFSNGFSYKIENTEFMNCTHYFLFRYSNK